MMWSCALVQYFIRPGSNKQPSRYSGCVRTGLCVIGPVGGCLLKCPWTRHWITNWSGDAALTASPLLHPSEEKFVKGRCILQWKVAAHKTILKCPWTRHWIPNSSRGVASLPTLCSVKKCLRASMCQWGMQNRAFKVHHHREESPDSEVYLKNGRNQTGHSTGFF